MPKFLLRIVAVLLIPCMTTGSQSSEATWCASQKTILIGSSSDLFSKQALSPHLTSRFLSDYAAIGWQIARLTFVVIVLGTTLRNFSQQPLSAKQGPRTDILGAMF